MNKADEIINNINSEVEKTFVTPQFDVNWKEYARDNYKLDVVINIAWKQGRRAILLERALRDLINKS